MLLSSYLNQSYLRSQKYQIYQLTELTWSKELPPITFLPLTWKLLTGIIAEEIYGFLENGGILPKEQNGCRRKWKVTSGKLGTSYTNRYNASSESKMKEEQLSYDKDRLSESSWNGPSLLSDRELKYDGHSKKCGEFFWKKGEVLEGGANLWCWETLGSTYKEKGFSRGCGDDDVRCLPVHTHDCGLGAPCSGIM